MSNAIDIKVPDIGDFTDVPVIELFVKVGDTVKAEDPLVSLESDKATMDIPAPQAGTVRELRVGVGDEVSQGDLLLTLEAAGAEGGAAQEHVTEEATPATSEPAGYGSPAGVYDRLEVRVPDIGEYENVPVIEVHVAPGASRGTSSLAAPAWTTVSAIPRPTSSTAVSTSSTSMRVCGLCPASCSILRSARRIESVARYDVSASTSRASASRRAVTGVAVRSGSRLT